MITKGDIVDLAIRKLIGDRSTALTGIEPDSYSKAVEDLEAMLARWQSDGIDLLYNFAEDMDVKTWSRHDSGLELWMKMPVACNLAILIAPDFHREPPATTVAEAGRGWRSIAKKFGKSRSLKPALPLPASEGEMHSGEVNNPHPVNPVRGFRRG
ncbi:packaged DNA stabilization gp4 family protein [Lelliottia wanjuensis]|uniref:packaged DNA stabilization gp4 family protein n=1 Tax=Lelliottia wanjuensis TaxID=3050585 RepID=UPI00254EDB39|nr:packaged DNA stabilization gp4 family protein [Lelliottia sp. V86_10]MDK9585418.1 packaged DNA stabilization gp4 family protein [Lelliottia sp. V86_10]